MVLFTLLMCGVVGRDELNREGLLKFGLFFFFFFFFFSIISFFRICFVLFLFCVCLFVCLAQGALAHSPVGGRTNMDFSGLVSFRFKESWN